MPQAEQNRKEYQMCGTDIGGYMILDDLAEATRNRIRKQKEAIPPEELRRRAESMKADLSLIHI